MIQTDAGAVLVVDDEPAVCAMIRDGLRSAGLRCVSATDPHQAKQLLDTKPFAVVVADVMMPDVSGLDLLAHVHRSHPRCKVILITGFSSPDRLASAITLGAYDYLAKPFPVDDLVEAVARAAADAGPGGGPLRHRAARALEGELEFKTAFLESIRALVRAVEAKDPHTRRHSEHVRHYAVNLCKFLGVPPDVAASVRTAALLHDVGKIGVPDQVLTKPGPLSDEEFQEIRRHPGLGAEILGNISMFANEAELVRRHHENWDGSGYPDGLAGEAIPLGARIINVADAIDAMLMHRTYKLAFPVEKMLGELARCAGGQFAPDIAEAAIRWCRENSGSLILASARVA